MKKWEYIIDYAIESLIRRKLLNNRGKEGWELVSVIADDQGTDFYWKREIIEK